MSKQKTDKKAGSAVYVLVDTSTLLHYKPFTQINWTKLVKSKFPEAAESVLYFPLSLISEVGKKKYDGSKTVKERARVVDSMIIKNTKANQFVTLKDGVKTFADVGSQDFDFASKGLSDKSSDDHHLAALLKVRDSGKEVAVISGDGNMNFKADLLSIHIIAPDDADRLPDNDEETKQLRKLQKRVAELESGCSDIAIQFEGGKPQTNFEFVSPVSRGTQRDFATAVEKDHPLLNPSALFLTTPQETHMVKTYNKRMHNFREALVGKFHELVKYDDVHSRTIEISFVAINSGKKAGDKVKITVAVDEGIRLTTSPVEPPELPEKPELPKGPFDFEMPMYSMPQIVPLADQIQSALKNQDGWLIGTGEAAITIDHVLHDGKPVALPPLWLVLTKQYEPDAVNISYGIIDKNAHEAKNGNLVVRITRPMFAAQPSN